MKRIDCSKRRGTRKPSREELCRIYEARRGFPNFFDRTFIPAHLQRSRLWRRRIETKPQYAKHIVRFALQERGIPYVVLERMNSCVSLPPEIRTNEKYETNKVSVRADGVTSVRGRPQTTVNARNWADQLFPFSVNRSFRDYLDDRKCDLQSVGEPDSSPCESPLVDGVIGDDAYSFFRIPELLDSSTACPALETYIEKLLNWDSGLYSGEE